MRKLALLLVTCVVAVVGVAASVAGADPGNGVPTVQFAATYSGFTCKGERIVTTGKNASVRDRETCQASGHVLPEGTYTIVTAAPDYVTTTDWYSDYEAFVNPGGVFVQAVSGTVDVKDRKDGTQVWQIHATY